MDIQSKAKGGARPGAGRKKDELVTLRKSTALGLVTAAQEKKMWMLFRTSTDQNVALRAFLAWNERAYGRSLATQFSECGVYNGAVGEGTW